MPKKRAGQYGWSATLRGRTEFSGLLTWLTRSQGRLRVLCPIPFPKEGNAACMVCIVDRCGGALRQVTMCPWRVSFQVFPSAPVPTTGRRWVGGQDVPYVNTRKGASKGVYTKMVCWLSRYDVSPHTLCPSEWVACLTQRRLTLVGPFWQSRRYSFFADYWRCCIFSDFSFFLPFSFLFFSVFYF